MARAESTGLVSVMLNCPNYVLTIAIVGVAGLQLLLKVANVAQQIPVLLRPLHLIRDC
jgi:hypothetical protein